MIKGRQPYQLTRLLHKAVLDETHITSPGSTSLGDTFPEYPSPAGEQRTAQRAYSLDPVGTIGTVRFELAAGRSIQSSCITGELSLSKPGKTKLKAKEFDGNLKVFSSGHPPRWISANRGEKWGRDFWRTRPRI
jgi:hypothetical protein